MNKKIFDVTGIGCSAWDLIGIIKNYPARGEKERFISFEEHPGGQVATALVTVSRLGGKTAIIDNVGDDTYGGKIREALLEENIDVAHLYTDIGKTSLLACCMISQDTGERTIFFTTGTKRILGEEDVPDELILSSKCIMIDTHHGKASIKGATLARGANIPVVTDLERDYGYTEKLFQLGTHHIIPRDYILKYTGENDEERALKSVYHNYKPETVITTLGEDGSIAYDGKEIIVQKAYKTGNTLDTTGAGDVFHGSFAFGLTRGYSLKENLKFASLVAGIKCGKLGGQKGIPYKEEIDIIYGKQ